jgi:hypothetical protein
MKKTVTMSLALLAIVCIVGSVSAGQLVNGVDQGKGSKAPTVNTCWVSDAAQGTAVIAVPESGFVENMYWLNHGADGSFTNITKFVVKYNASSPLVKQVQIFENSGSITTPFGVPFWAGNPIHGPATLKVKTDSQKCTYLFSVTP